jgi:ATP-binding cassette subfamily B protein
MGPAKQTLRFYWSHLRKFKVELAGGMIILPFVTLVNNYIPPLILAVVLNRLSKHQYISHHVWASFGGDLIGYAILTLSGGAVLWRLFDIFFWRLEGKMERSIAQNVFSHLLSQSSDFHANQFSGSLVSQTNKIMNAYVRIADTTLFQVAPLVYGLIFVSIIMAPRAPLYTIILVGISTFYIISAFFVTGKVRRLSSEQAVAESHQTGVISDAISNIMAIKSFARDKYEISRFRDATDNTYHRLMQVFKAFQFQMIYFNTVTGLLAALSLLAAIISVVNFKANLATAFLIFNYTSSIIGQLFTFSNNALRNYNRAFGDASEMVGLLQIEPEVKDPKDPEKLSIKNGGIEFRDVSFTHSGSNDAIFKNFDLKIKDGEKIGLVGHSGAGKTTITRLILRFSDLDKGQILIDGQDIASISQNDLHESIAYVPQEPLLFHRSIIENITYGDLKASFKDIRSAAKKAHADEFISVLPKGYQTLVGERGVKLSGGQRQRIAIARAMLKSAPVLLLDEATSALDSESEVLIQDALWKLMAGRTTIVIAHRLSTIQKMDRILVLDKGKIVEQGSHSELLKLNGTYAKLWTHQSGGFLED